jgi:hypothetical protein
MIGVQLLLLELAKVHERQPIALIDAVPLIPTTLFLRTYGVRSALGRNSIWD